MTTASQNQEKFQHLLRELFQFDCADLDFGIYRIMNHKREVVEKFISEDLATAVSEELDQGILHDQELALSELQDTTRLIRETLGNTALDAAGNLNETYHDIPTGEKYLKLQRRTRGARSRATLERDIFNHLFAFFSRYYQEGDFISKRRYSRQQRYAIPYNGEEVYLHWANADQYYVKTAEHFHDYSYRVHGAAIHFKLQAADVEHNNVKGDKRFFLPRISDISVDANEKQLIIPFEYRPLDEQEHYGAADLQETIISECVAEMGSRPGLPNEIHLALTAERRRNAENEPVTYLEHHLRQYTRRNTSDFFIHKNLKAFLSRELEFYIKSEVLNLDDLELAGEGFAEGWFQVIRVIRTIGECIIDFLDQVEGFQKMLWEKRKFITETQYCITIAYIHERFYPEIASCEPQWMEWKELLHVDENQTDLFNSSGNTKDKRIIFMKDHPTLALDTKHFDEIFRDELLATIDDIDELCDGLLIHSENFQALTFLRGGYEEKVKCAYIDPPYNTDASAILYKNDYKDSSWLSLMESRLSLSKNLLSQDGILCCAIDEEEAWRLRALLQKLFVHEIGVASVRSNPVSRKSTGKLSPSHEYAYFFGNSSDANPGNIIKTEKQLQRYPYKDSHGRYAWLNFIRSGSNDRREDAPKMFYPIFVRDNDSIRIPEMRWNEENKEYEVLVQPESNETVIWPVREQDGVTIEKNWQRGWERVARDMSEYRVRRDQSGNINIDFKVRLDVKAPPSTWWADAQYASSNYGPGELKKLFGSNGFDFAKAPKLVQDCLRTASNSQDRFYVMDYFAGSGTTGHAVINLNREDDGKRKFILVEMGQYFDTVLLPRLKKVTFTPEWKEGKPRRMATQEEAERGPRIIKYLRLESYEDALNNIEVDDSASQQAMRFDDYLISYMLQAETRHSATLLNVEQLARPFDYKLFIRNNGATGEQRIDIPETFNYLLGLQVQTRRVYHDEERRYLVLRGLLEGRQTTVLWRETEGWQKPELERDLQFVTEQKLTEEADEIYANGDSFIPGAKSLDPVFKARMFALIPE